MSKSTSKSTPSPKGRVGVRPSKPYAWVPTLYFAEAVPMMLVTSIAGVMFVDLGLDDPQIAFYTAWLYLPWVIKPLWSPIVDALRTKRWWIIAMQLLMGGALGCVALTLHADWWLQGTLCLFWLIAFSSATHDIAADGFYILGLGEQEQALYVGVRNTFYRVGMIFCQGLVVMLAGVVARGYGVTLGWAAAIMLTAVVMLLLGLWHWWFLPKVETSPSPSGREPAPVTGVLRSFADTLRVFLRKPKILASLLFMTLFRFPEAQLNMMAKPFMKRSIDEGGLQLTNEAVGFMTGTVGVISLLAGGLLGGWAVSRHGLRRWWWPMVVAISVPDLVYVYFAYVQPTEWWILNAGVAFEQFGYGFGFTAYSLFLVYFARGEKSTSVFSLCTGIQALGMMLPGMIAGQMADTLGYTNFFLWVVACCLVTVLVSALVRPAKGEANK